MDRLARGFGMMIGWALVLTAAGFAIAYPLPVTMAIAMALVVVQSVRLIHAKRVAQALAIRCAEAEAAQAEADLGDARLEMMLRMAAKVGEQNAELRMRDSGRSA